MVKRKIKLQIIEDYIKILKLEVLLPSCEEFKLGFVRNIKNKYDKIFFKIGLMDNSLNMLKSDFMSLEKCALKNCVNEIVKLESEVENINEKLPTKLSNLGFNDLEKSFVLNG